MDGVITVAAIAASVAIFLVFENATVAVLSRPRSELRDIARRVDQPDPEMPQRRLRVSLQAAIGHRFERSLSGSRLKELLAQSDLRLTTVEWISLSITVAVI